ncbi:MAG: FAD-dependent oxidoreductase [Bacteroidales bacterium]|nr:FAD-dependent oxidoreductase [Bacteroidales bacterium]
MRKEIILRLSPQEAFDKNSYKKIVEKIIKISSSRISYVKVLNKSVDARNKDIKVNLKLLLVIDEQNPKFEKPEIKFQNVSNSPEIIIIGCGPAGLFAAIRLIELGFKPVIIERGKNVKERKKDIVLIQRNQSLNPDSNYCFGEGGAGAFSDGKLFTRSKKRGNVKRILEIFNFFGASEDILIDAHPHIGSDKLPAIITNMRNAIINCGGEIHFNTKVVDFIIDSNTIKGIKTDKDINFYGNAVILATGHSARDIYHIFSKNKLVIEAKPFAMGVRVEHPQSIINSIQYHNSKQAKYLPSATYKLVSQIKDRGVYSFCMCPGGFIVPASTGENEIVVNGMSAFKRNSKFANSGIVVEIRNDDLHKYHKFNELAGLEFQKQLEHLSFTNSGDGLIAPAQRLSDFVAGNFSSSLPLSSYTPGIVSSPMHKWLPEIIKKTLQKGFVDFNKKKKGFLTNEAIIVGVESRSSSPVRIPRDKTTMQHIEIKRLFPCGEGAGYAGGIVSSAIDGMNCAEKVCDI